MRTLMIMAGGTGGHVYPALAVARALAGRGVSIVWLGTRRGIEARVVPAAGYPVAWIRIRGLRGKGVVGWLLAPLRLALALAQAVAAILRHRPDALLGMGGFAAGPGGLAAWLLRRPLLVHEANAIAGLTNRLLARLADRVMTGFPACRGLSGDKVIYTGNPVRPEIAALPAPEARLPAAPPARLRLLVVGGSQGARVFNQTVPAALGRLAPERRPEVWHQCGRGNGEATRAAYRAAGVADARVEEFIDDMARAYGWTHLALCRAGAMTVAELAGAGCPAILVPYPHAAGDHQSANARFLADAGAALLIPQAEFDAGRLADHLAALAGDWEGVRRRARRAHRLGRPQATSEVARICLETLRA